MHALHDALKRHLLALLLVGYVVAALFPSFGLGLRTVAFRIPGGSLLSLPVLMLSWLLVSAGLGVHATSLRGLLRHPRLLVAGVVANAALPLLYAGLVRLLGFGWHNSDEVQNVLVGLALIGAMPIAGSSTAWAQNAEGDLALSLGLVLLSTSLSPLLTPLCLWTVGHVTTGDYAEDLQELARQGSGAFVAWSVVVPSLVGLGLRWLLGPKRILRMLPWIKLVTLLDLLLLNYANACAVLPQVLRQPDWDFLGVILVVTGTLCALAFAVGYILSRLLRATAPQRTSLMFGLGMNNNGAGLVLATLTLADHPLVLLPVLGYNLVQQVAAGVVDRWLPRGKNDAPQCVKLPS